MNSFAENIKNCREKQNISVEELARKMRVGPRVIANYESGGHIPSIETILKLSTVLDIPASELLRPEVHLPSGETEWQI